LPARVIQFPILGSLIVVVAAVGGLVGIVASLRDPAQSWLTDSQRFSRLEERLRPITAPFEKLQHATEQLEKATTPRDGPPIQKVEVTRPGLSGLLSTGSGLPRRYRPIYRPPIGFPWASLAPAGCLAGGAAQTHCRQQGRRPSGRPPSAE
jgi:hypothetical protein